MAPRLSAVIPTHNDAIYLKEAVESLLAQPESEDMEILIIDDGSDPPAEMVCPIHHPDVRFLYENRQGVSAARNRGLAAAAGEFIVFLDVDDICLPGRIGKQLEILERFPKVGLVGGDITRRDLDGHEQSWGIFEAVGREIEAEAVGEKQYIFDDQFPRLLLEHYPFNTSVMMMRREVLLENIRFDRELLCWEDWDLVTRIARKWDVGYVRQPVVLYRKRVGSITTSPNPRKFISRALMFCKWRAELPGLTEEDERMLLEKEHQAWLVASYEFRRANRHHAFRYAWRAFRLKADWAACKSLLAAVLGHKKR